MIREPLDPFSEVVDEQRKWLPDWYGWLQQLVRPQLEDYVDDAAAKAAGVPLNGYYRTGSIVKIRVLP